MTTYQKIIQHSVDNSDVSTEDHLIEECSELIKELCNEKRGRESFILLEMADLLFQIDKYLFLHGISTEQLKMLSIDKTNVKFPGLLQTFNNPLQ
ncbi:MAG: hypothetical protein WBB27_10055 [Maribacter sp.]